MTFFQYSDIDVTAGEIQSGKIITVDRANLKATVEMNSSNRAGPLSEDYTPGASSGGGNILSNVPIHYHCNEDDVEDSGVKFDGAYPDAMDERGASAFARDDRVLVLFRSPGQKDPVIIGFVDKAGSCCSFLFNLRGEDGPELITGASFYAYDRSQQALPIIDLEYNEIEQAWSFTLDSEYTGSQYSDCSDSYWVRYKVPGYKLTQYHSIDADKGDFWQKDDMVLGDGTLLFDILDILEGTIGFWEDWEDDEFCGKHTWTVVSCEQAAGEESCPSLPFSSVDEYSECSISLVNEILSMAFNRLSEEGGNPQFSIYWESSEEDLGRLITKLILKLSSLSSISSGNDGVYMSIEDSNGNYAFLILSGYTDSDFDDMEDWYRVGDNDGEEMILDLKNDYGLSGKVASTQLILNCNYVGNLSLDIDYIDFPRWEDWDKSEESSLCKFHNWKFQLISYSELCPNLPVDVTDYHVGTGGETIHHLSISSGILNWSVSKSVRCSSDFYLFWLAANETEYITDVTKLILKCTASVSGTYPDPNPNLLWSISIGAIGNTVELVLAGNIPWYVEGFIGDNGGLEMEIDLTEYGISSSDIIRSVTFTYSVNYSNGENRTGDLTVDYIDFR